MDYPPPSMDLSYPSEWTVTSRGTLQRPLRGFELLINNTEERQNGSFELTMYVTWYTTISEDDVEARFAAAWWRARQEQPVVGVEFVDENGKLDKGTYPLLKTVEEAEQWIKDTAKVIRDGRSVLDVVNEIVARPMPSKGRRAMMYLVLNPIVGDCALVYNTSHVFSGHHAIKVCESVSFNLMQDQSARGLHANFEPEDPNWIIPRLPRSSSRAYEETYNPTPEDLEEGVEVQMQSVERFAKPTIGVPVHKNWRNRRSHVHCVPYSIGSAETTAAVKALKKLDINVTTAFFACITAAIAQLYPAEAKKGAHLLFAAHAQRHVETTGSDGKPAVTMGVMPADTYLDASDVDLAPTDKQGLTILSKAIAWEMINAIDCPHVLGALDSTFGAMYGPDADPMEPEEPTIARPTLTSQGPLLSYADVRGAGRSHSSGHATGGGYAGRNCDPSICFATCTFRTEFRWHVLFDEQYHDYNEVIALTQRVAALFRILYQDDLKVKEDVGGYDPFKVVPYHRPHYYRWPAYYKEHRL